MITVPAETPTLLAHFPNGITVTPLMVQMVIAAVKALGRPLTDDEAFALVPHVGGVQ